MNTKTIVAGLLAGLTTFLLGWLIYGILLSVTFAELSGSATGVSKSDTEMMAGASMVYLIIGQFTLGMFLAFVFSKWASIATLSGGAKGGATIGLFTAIGWDYTMLGTPNVSTLQRALLHVVLTIVVTAVARAIADW